MLPESIVVGITNVEIENEILLIQYKSTGHKQATYLLKSAAFIRLLKELQPYIDSNFNTSTSKTIIGQSLGGFSDRNLKIRNYYNYIIVSPVYGGTMNRY
jgi:enterochelin esterase-like enzyme